MSNLSRTLHRNLAQALREARLDDAAAVLQRLKQEDALSVQTRGGELELLLRSGRLDDAAVLAEQLVTTFPESARVLFLAGQVAYRRRDYEQAVQLLQESCRISSHWRNRHWHGKALTQLGRHEEAEPILTAVAAEHTHAETDLAWLYERKGDITRAISAFERFLQVYPDDRWATQQLDRLRARTLDAGQLAEEMTTLLELGEEVPPALVPEFIESLLRTGQGARARQLVAELETGLDDRTATRLAWSCRQLLAYDLSFRLFLRTLPHNLGSVKFLTALERDAARSGRLPELIERYREHAADTPRLWGRIRRLESRLER